MSEYIMGLGISVKICKIYEELIYLTFSESDMTDEYYDNIYQLKDLIEEETDTYNKLSDDDINRYFNKINDSGINELDAVKSRYYSKIKERKDLLDSNKYIKYPFTLNTAIAGKILLDTLIEMEKYFSKELNNLSRNDDNFYNLYSYHKVHKFTLLSTNDFAERLVVDFDFELNDIPDVSFEKIKKNFRCNDNFYKYLNNLLLMISKEIIDELSKNSNELDIYSSYSTLLNIFQLQVILKHLNKDSLISLYSYLNALNISNLNNKKYVKKLILDKLNGDK